jgi:hypothetical protein
MRSAVDGVDTDSWVCIFGLHQQINDFSDVTLGGRFVFRESGSGVVEVSDTGSGTGYLVQGASTGETAISTDNGQLLNPAGSEATKAEIRTWYQNNYDSGNVASQTDIWKMYPKQSDVELNPDISYRHPGEFYNNN